jgi:predicted house-cleaning noncanonical NTP pyrophosphatase (MazG superfamily)
MAKKHNKLVRDKIPEHISNKGGNPIYHIADEKEYWEKLKEKLLEEVDEFRSDESAEEFADLLEVIDAIAEYKDFDRKEIEKIRDVKAEERGRFKNRVILDES